MYRSTILLTIVGVEFQAADAGLGYLITYGGQIIQMNLVMTAIVVLAAISSVLFVIHPGGGGDCAAPSRRRCAEATFSRSPPMVIAGRAGWRPTVLA